MFISIGTIIFIIALIIDVRIAFWIGAIGLLFVAPILVIPIVTIFLYYLFKDGDDEDEDDEKITSSN